MKLTLDLLTKKHKFYYIGWGITVATFASLGIFAYIDLEINSRFEPFFIGLILPCSIFSVLFFSAMATGLLAFYLKDGELVLTDDYLTIDNITIPITEIKYINLKMAPRNIKSWVLDRNLITLGDKSGHEYKRRFAVKSYNQNEAFEHILAAWREKGVGIYAYHDVIIEKF